MYGLLAAAQLRLVHNVVMDKGESVENLKCQGRVEDMFLNFVREEVIGEQTKLGAQSLSSN